MGRRYPVRGAGSLFYWSNRCASATIAPAAAIRSVQRAAKAPRATEVALPAGGTDSGSAAGISDTRVGPLRAVPSIVGGKKRGRHEGGALPFAGGGADGGRDEE